MNRETQDLEQMVRARHRDTHVVTSLVILALAGGVALLWPSVRTSVSERFGPGFPSQFLLGDLLALVVLFVIYLWRKSGQIGRLVHRLLDESDRSSLLEERLAQARAVLQASTQLDLNTSGSTALQKILQCVTEALRADRGVLYRIRADNRPLERETAYPSTEQSPDPLALAFEDEVARRVASLSTMLVIDEHTNLKQLGISTTRPRSVAPRMIAAPLLLEGKPAGALLLCNPDAGADDAPDSERLSLLEVFAGFAAGVLRNLKTFQAIARRNEELMRARQLLCDHQRELAEIEAVTTMARVSRCLAHGLSGPLTAIAGYTDVVLTCKPDELNLVGARDGLRREIDALKTRLCKVVDFLHSWRRQYGLVDLNQMVDTAVALHAEPLRARGVTCRFEPHPGLPFTVADPVRLRQVFLNLLNIAQEYLETNGSAQELRVRTLADAGKVRVLFDFRGRPGLTEFLAPLLSSTVDINELTRERTLDLPVVAAILRDHLGELRVETIEDRRTRITVELPVQSEPPDNSAVGSSEAETSSSLDEILGRLFDEPAAVAKEKPAPAARPAPQVVSAPAAAAPERPTVPLRPATGPVLRAVQSPTRRIAPRTPLPPPTTLIPGPNLSPLATPPPAVSGGNRSNPSFPVGLVPPEPEAIAHLPTAVPPPSAAPELPPPALSMPAAAPPRTSLRNPSAATPTKTSPADSGSGLDAIFQPSEMWTGARPQMVARPPDPTGANDHSAPQTLLDESELEGALRLFDEASQSHALARSIEKS